MWPESLIATHSGLRGRTADLTPAVVRGAVEGLVSLVRERGCPLVLGVAHDDRPGGGSLAAEVATYATGAGADVLEFGAISTPAAKLAARMRGLGGAIVVTGSHLEPDWNGLKLVAAPRYVPVDLRTLPVPTDSGTGPAGRIRSEGGAASDHAAAICGTIDVELVRNARLAVDWSGGVGRGPELLLERLGCLGGGTGAQLGLRIDPDGDRLALVDEGGVALDSEVVLPLVALAREARAVVKGADTSRMVDDVLAARGGSVRTTTPGELHLLDALGEDGDLAGEGNGGVVVPAVGMARDALAAAAAILELMARTKLPISALAAELPRYFRRRSTVVRLGEEGARIALDAVATRMGAAPARDTEQGVLVEAAGGAWGLVRRSATEPVLRVTVEAPTEAAADALHAELRAALPAGTDES